MQSLKFHSSILPRDKNSALLLSILVIGLLLALGTISILIFADDQINPFKEMYLMPWVLLVGTVFAAPSVYLIVKKKFNLYHPLVFAAWSYFIPAFFFGGMILASNLSQPYFLAFVEDERYNLPLTFVYIAIGYAGLSVGFFLPVGRKLGEKVSRRLPVWNWKSEQILLPSFILFCFGLANTVIAFGLGILGYQKVEEIGAFDGLLFLLTLFWLEASVFLWLSIFRAGRVNFNHYVIIGILLSTALVKSAFQGNRGSLFQIFIIVAATFILSGRQVKFKQGAIGASLLTLAIIVGMIYGTTFRNLKQTEAQIGIEQYTEYVFGALEKVFERNPLDTLDGGFKALAERLEAVSSLAVVVSNYEKLKPYEESYGLDNNIWKDSITFFIPRPLWNDKPLASEPRKYGDLYFNYSENSFTITPMGDLLRNFGPIGVPLGMILLGFIIRVIYAALVENQTFSYWRTTLYIMLLIGISYESFYGSIIPYLVRVSFISIIGILIVKFFVRRQQGGFGQR